MGTSCPDGLITHNKKFVHMMKQELDNQSCFEIPEQYLHISQEEKVDVSLLMHSGHGLGC